MRKKLIMPKTLKVRLTIFFVPFVNIMIIIAMSVVGLYIGKALLLNSVMQFVMMGFFIVLGVAGVAGNPWVSKTENYKVLLGILKQDRNKYYPLYKKGVSRNDEKAN